MVFVSFENNRFIYSDVKTDFNFQIFPVKHKHVYVVWDNDIITNDFITNIDRSSEEKEEKFMEPIYLDIMNIILQLEHGIFDKNYESFSDTFRKSNIDRNINLNSLDDTIYNGVNIFRKFMGIGSEIPRVDQFGSHLPHSFGNPFGPHFHVHQPHLFGPHFHVHQHVSVGIEILNLIDPLDTNFLNKHNYHQSENIRDYLPLIKAIFKKIINENIAKQYFIGTKEDAIIKFYHLNDDFDSPISINLDYGEDIFIIDGGSGRYSIILDNSR